MQLKPLALHGLRVDCFASKQCKLVGLIFYAEYTTKYMVSTVPTIPCTLSSTLCPLKLQLPHPHHGTNEGGHPPTAMFANETLTISSQHQRAGLAIHLVPWLPKCGVSIDI